MLCHILNPVKWNVDCIIEFQKKRISVCNQWAHWIKPNKIYNKEKGNKKIESRNAMKSNKNATKNSFEWVQWKVYFIINVSERTSVVHVIREKETQRTFSTHRYKIKWKIRRTTIKSIQFTIWSGWNDIFATKKKRKLIWSAWDCTWNFFLLLLRILRYVAETAVCDTLHPIFPCLFKSIENAFLSHFANSLVFSFDFPFWESLRKKKKKKMSSMTENVYRTK